MAKKPPVAPAKTLAGKPVGTLIHTDPRSLVMNPQFRTESDPKADAELYESIKLHGVKSPILAHRYDDKLVVTAGHRRTRMAIEAELATVPVYVTDTAADDVPVEQLVENLQRLDMSLKDTAAGVFTIYMGQAMGSAQQVAALLGKPKSWVSKMLTLADSGLKDHNTVARSLLARDLLSDLESAYMLCNIEAIDKSAAQAIADNIVAASKLADDDDSIPRETRATIAAKLKALKGKAPAPKPKTEGDSGNDSEPTEDAPIFTRDMLVFIRKLVTDAEVKPADLTRKAEALAALTEAIAQGE